MTFVRQISALSLALALTACATPSGVAVPQISEPAIAAAYLPLSGRVHLGLDRAAGAAMEIAPGIAVTNVHNANLLDKNDIIASAMPSSDLLFFRRPGTANPTTAAPVVGESVTAYGQDTDGRLRQAHGTVSEIARTPGYADSPYFIFAGNAGPGFSGGPVVDAAGKLIGITFGYKDDRGKRLIYAYDMKRVMAEFSRLENTSRLL